MYYLFYTDFAFFFRAIPVEEQEVDADLVDDLEVDRDLVDDPEIDGDLVDDPKVDGDLVDDPEVDADLVDDPEVDEDLVDDPEVDEDLVDDPEGDLAGRSKGLEADLLEDLEADEELEKDLDEDDEELEKDLDEDDEELGEDLDEDDEADENETSACAPYLACEMSCLGSRTPGVKDTPFLGSVWGAEEVEERLLPGGFVNTRDLRASKHHRDTRSLSRFRPPGG